MKLFEKKLSGFPIYWFIILALILIMGIVIGSFYDKEISMNIADPNNVIGKIGENFGSVLGLGMLPVAGSMFTIIFLKKKEPTKKNKIIGIAIGAVSILLAAGLNSLTFSGQDGWSWKFNLFLGVFIQAVFYSGIFFLAYHFINPDTSITNLLTTAITIVGIYAAALILTNFILKGVAYRPRFRSLMFDNTLNNTKAAGIQYYREWWQFNWFKYPYEQIMPIHDYAKSWPSGHSTSAALVLCIPLYVSVSKHSNNITSGICFAIGAITMFVVMFLRILAGAHYLSDVCFGALVTFICLIIGLIVKQMVETKLEQNKSTTNTVSQ